jgi:hypothetical protein
MTTPTPTGPVCALCGAPAVVNWQRRLTDGELDAHLALEQEKRDGRMLLADPQATPDFGPLPQADDCTRPVYACGPHAIAMDAAALVHQATCTAPNPDHLPGCGCTPEPAPQPAEAEPSRLPAHWIT